MISDEPSISDFRMVKTEVKDDEQAGIDVLVKEYLDTLDLNSHLRDRIQYALSVEASKNSYGGKTYRGNRAAIVREMLDDGYSPKAEEVPTVKEIASTRYNRMSAREHADLKRRKSETGTRTEYRLEFHDGSFFVLTRSEYDYAVWVGESRGTPLAWGLGTAQVPK